MCIARVVDVFGNRVLGIEAFAMPRRLMHGQPTIPAVEQVFVGIKFPGRSRGLQCEIRTRRRRTEQAAARGPADRVGRLDFGSRHGRRKGRRLVNHDGMARIGLARAGVQLREAEGGRRQEKGRVGSRIVRSTAANPHEDHRPSRAVGLDQQIAIGRQKPGQHGLREIPRDRQLRLLEVDDLGDKASVDCRFDFLGREADGNRKVLRPARRRMQPVDHLDRRIQLNPGEFRHVGKTQAIDESNPHVELGRRSQIDPRFAATVVNGHLSLRRERDLHGLQNSCQPFAHLSDPQADAPDGSVLVKGDVAVLLSDRRRQRQAPEEGRRQEGRDESRVTPGPGEVDPPPVGHGRAP